MRESLLGTWNTHNRINLFLLNAVSPEALESMAGEQEKSVAHQFAHIHNVRLLWLNVSAPCYSVGLCKIEKDDVVDKEILKKALQNSGKAIEKLLTQAIDHNEKVKGFNAPLLTFLGYMISHESHHRGQIVLTLKLAGYPLDKNTSYGIWEWDKKLTESGKNSGD